MSQRRLDLPYGTLPSALLFFREHVDFGKRIRELVSAEPLLDLTPFTIHENAGLLFEVQDERGQRHRGRFLRVMRVRS